MMLLRVQLSSTERRPFVVDPNRQLFVKAYGRRYLIFDVVKLTILLLACCSILHGLDCMHQVASSSQHGASRLFALF
ncbi:hypothetical protein N5C93_30875, partial [Pseudomonas nitroreducens]|uniref:hypothetical protein n=1 Tax=Pseudomonas nitroreducens TaxID=46680 RepID=UPI00244B8CDC